MVGLAFFGEFSASTNSARGLRICAGHLLFRGESLLFVESGIALGLESFLPFLLPPLFVAQVEEIFITFIEKKSLPPIPPSGVSPPSSEKPILVYTYYRCRGFYSLLAQLGRFGADSSAPMGLTGESLSWKRGRFPIFSRCFYY